MYTGGADKPAFTFLRPSYCSGASRGCSVQKFFLIGSFMILGLIGFGGEANVSTTGTAPVSLIDADGLGSPVVPALLYSDSNTADMWGGSANLVAVAAYRHRRYRRHRRVVVRKRKFSHSAAIVGGSAAGGAAIGALAGGGKGAAVGALVGGGAGLAYDRSTAKKKRVIVE